MFCSKCGNKLPNEAVFCSRCGNRVRELGDIMEAQHRADMVEHRHAAELRRLSSNIGTNAYVHRGGNDPLSNSKVFIGISVGLILMILVVVYCTVTGAINTDEQQARKIVEDFFESVKSGDVSGAVECFTPAFQEQYNAVLKAGGLITSMVGLPDVSGLVNPFLGVNDYYSYKNYEFKVKSVTLDNDKKKGSVNVEVYIDGSLSSTTAINVSKYQGKWYIEN